MAHREAGRDRNIVLLHGLGMSSRYFAPLARALFDDGWSPIAPDVPGFGESANAPAMTPREQAELLAGWADSLGIRDAVWVGHSTGCTAVAHVAAERPDIVRRAVAIGPLWSRTRHPHWRFATALAVDAFREPLALWPFIVSEYWRTGVARWLATWRKQIGDVVVGEDTSYESVTMIAGDRDALVDRELLHPIGVPGPHACNFTNPVETAGQIRSSLFNSEPVPAGVRGSHSDPARA